jgi:chromate transporter
MLLIKIFIVFLKIGLLSIGGTYSFLPVFQKEICYNLKWIEEDELLSLIGFTEIIPGALSIKVATYVGFKQAGILGAVVANLGNAFVPFVIMFFVGAFYWKIKNDILFKKISLIFNPLIAALIIGIIIKNFINNMPLNINLYIIPAIIIGSLVYAFFIKLEPTTIIIFSFIISLILAKIQGG